MSKQAIRAIEGTKDILGLKMQYYKKILRAAENNFSLYNYRRIATPIFENTTLFSRSLGEVTDIVEKEMYTFTPGSDTITLRPEGTAGVVRAYLQHNLHKEGGLQKLWYSGPMFRRERPQKGRQRQFHQIGVEALGSADPLLDAEVITTALAFYKTIGLGDVKTKINSIGCQKTECRPAFREKLRQALQPELNNLCQNCQRRYESNIMRILDCKNPHCQEIRTHLPKCVEHLCPDCLEHHKTVEEALTASGFAYTSDPFIVRGLDYYTKTVFEFTHSALGAQDAIGAGGRYDGLVAELGGPETPAIGFALGIERIQIAMEAISCCSCQIPLTCFGIAVGEQNRKALTGLIFRMRQAGISCDLDYDGRSFKSQLRKANRLGALKVLILGDDELAAGEVTVKDMRTGGKQQRVPLADFLNTVKAGLDFA